MFRMETAFFSINPTELTKFESNTRGCVNGQVPVGALTGNVKAPQQIGSRAELPIAIPKSALEWIIDQYQVKGESDPNRDDDPGYIVRLVGQVVRISVETARIVNALPAFLPNANM
jgi:hypothetical protein